MRTVFRAALLAAALAVAAPAAFAQDVTLRPTIAASGNAITLGDLFADAGPAGARAIAPAPAAGRTATLSPRFVQAAARAAGLAWTPPDGLAAITVAGRGAETAGVARFERTAASTGDIAVRRGEIVTLVYVAPGMQLTARARATEDAGVGAVTRLVNLQSNRSVEATVTGIATASANLR
jgi:flagella basal body P-ring formation protein FlgA